MVTRAKKPILTLKNGPINNHNDWFSTLKVVWGICKRAWQVPFLWSLAFYLFWEARDILVWNKSLWEGNYWNYVGIAVSVAALLTKTPLAKGLMRAAIIAKAQLGTIFKRMSFQRVQTELHKAYVMAGTQIGTWTKKAAFLTVLNAMSNLKRGSAHAGTVIRTRIQARFTSASAPTVLDIGMEKFISPKRPEHQPLQAQQKTPTEGRKRKSMRQLRRKFSMDLAPSFVDVILPGAHVFNENSMQCLVCSHLIECFYERDKSASSENQHHAVTRCPFPKEPQRVEIIA
jgi:hypothetical protein